VKRKDAYKVASVYVAYGASILKKIKLHRQFVPAKEGNRRCLCCQYVAQGYRLMWTKRAGTLPLLHAKEEKYILAPS
jgi:hypothetical protein